MQESKYPQIMAISPMVERVVKQLRDSALKKLDVDTKVDARENYYYWGIGYPAVIDGWRFFQCAVRVEPVWSADGKLVALRTALNLPNDQSLIDLGAKHGLQFAGAGATMSAHIEHAPEEQPLVDALQRLFPPEFLKSLLVEMHSYWGDQF